MPRRGAVLPLIALIVAAQVAVPAWGLFNKPARFGWQMYAGNSTALEMTRVYAGGTRRALDPADLDLIANYRGEVAYERHLPPLLCARDRRVRFVLVERERPHIRLRHRCSSA